MEFRERGIFQLPNFQLSNWRGSVFTSWASIDYCKWTEVPGGLRVVPRLGIPDPFRVLPKGSIPPGEIGEATAILSRFVEVRDVAGRVLNPEFVAAGRPTAAAPPELTYGRFQFSLGTMLFFVLVASSAMSWYGIQYRRDVEETALLAQLERFKPAIERYSFRLALNFSASPIKPGDRDLELVAKLSRLEDLDLTGSPVTDAGLVHLEKLTSLRWLKLWQTQVTDVGVKRLQRALPKAKIYH